MTISLSAKTPNDLAAFACVALGFIPSESIVMLGIEGANMHARLDIPDEENIPAATDALLLPCLRNGVSSVAFVLFTEDRDLAEKAWSNLAAEFVGQGVQVRASILVRDGFWEALDAPFEVKGPLDIENHPFMLQVNFETGRAMRTSRDDLKREVEMRDTLDCVPVVATLDIDTLIGWVYDSFEACTNENRVLTDQELGVYLAAIQGNEARDRVNLFAAQALLQDKRVDALVSTLANAAARAPMEFRSVAASVYGFAAYMGGDGARAWVAIDLALEIDENNSLAQALGSAVEAAMPPRILAQTWVDITINPTA